MVLVRFNPDSGVRAIVSRPSHFGEPEVLALTDVGLHPVLGLSASGDPSNNDIASWVKLGSPLELWITSREGHLVPYVHGEDDEFWRATCDPATGLVYVGTKATILQVELGQDRTTVSHLVGVAGEEESIDGSGADARVDRPFCMIADGHGNLLIKDCGANRVRLVRLPPPGSPPGTMSSEVTTLPFEYAANLWAVALDYTDPQRLYIATKTAVYRHDALPYNISGLSRPRTSQPQQQGRKEAEEGAEPRKDSDPAPVLLAGREGDNQRTDGVVVSPPAEAPQHVQAHLRAFATGSLASAAAAALLPATADGLRGSGSASGSGSGSRSGATATNGNGASGSSSTARFGHITFMLVDATGRLIIVEREPHDVEPVLRVVWPGGLVTTFEADFEVTGSEFVMAILPYGWLALHAWDGSRVQLLRLDPGLRPSQPSCLMDPLIGGVHGGAGSSPVTAAPGQPGLRGLAGDLASLLSTGVDLSGTEAGGESECDNGVVASDVAVVVGDRKFRCHRAILGARCQYFRVFFKGGFADSGMSQITLPDADPAAFALLLRFLYCSTLDIPPPLLRPTAELADRLLLPAASRQAQAQLLAATCPTTVVDDLLWAEQHHFVDLLAGLKEYYLANAHAVLEEAPDSLEVLMLRSPKLHLELYAAGIKHARRR